MPRTRRSPLTPAPEDLSCLTEEEIVLGYRNLILAILNDVCRTLPVYASQEDLLSAGHLGLIEGARAFDPSRGVPASAYLATRVRRAMLDELRRLDPLSVHARAILRAVQSEATTEVALMTASETARVAQALGIAVDVVKRAQGDDAYSRRISLDTLIAVSDLHPAAGGVGIDPEETATTAQTYAYVRAALQELSARERQIVVRFHLGEETMREIAESLGLHHTRVAQILTSAAAKMRVAVEPERQPAATVGIAARRLSQYAERVADRVKADGGLVMAV